jgi:pyruvate dehydrogenase E1 component
MSTTSTSPPVRFGLGVAQTLFSSLAQHYVRAHGFALDKPKGRMIALAGDAELDEGNIFEAILEGWKQGLRNCWWIIDYNRQSLDAVIREGLWMGYEAMFRDFGGDVVSRRCGLAQAIERRYWRSRFTIAADRAANR